MLNLSKKRLFRGTLALPGKTFFLPLPGIALYPVPLKAKDYLDKLLRRDLPSPPAPLPQAGEGSDGA